VCVCVFVCMCVCVYFYVRVCKCVSVCRQVHEEVPARGFDETAVGNGK